MTKKNQAEINLERAFLQCLKQWDLMTTLVNLEVILTKSQTEVRKALKEANEQWE